MTVKFSIIIPVFNVENYIELCLDTIKNQKGSFECIIVNDGSTDESITIIRSKISNDARFTIIEQANSGVSVARNVGILAAAGEYIVCIDPDDIVSEHFLEYCSEVIQKTAPDMIIFGYRKIYEKTERVNNPHGCTYTQISQGKAASLHNYPWMRIVRRELFENNLFPPGLIYEDSVTIPVLINRSNKIIKINAILYGYRQRENSLTLSKESTEFQMFDALEELKARCIRQNIPLIFYYTVYAHLSRGALSTLGKMSLRKFSKKEIVEAKNKVWALYDKPNSLAILQSYACTQDKCLYLLIKAKNFGWIIFFLIFKIQSRCK